MRASENVGRDRASWTRIESLSYVRDRTSDRARARNPARNEIVTRDGLHLGWLFSEIRKLQAAAPLFLGRPRPFRRLLSYVEQHTIDGGLRLSNQDRSSLRQLFLREFLRLAIKGPIPFARSWSSSP